MSNKSLPQARALKKVSSNNNDSSLSETYQMNKSRLQELSERLKDPSDTKAQKEAWAFFSPTAEPKARQFYYKPDHFYLFSGNEDESTVQLIMVMGFCHRYSGFSRANSDEGASISFTKGTKICTSEERSLSLSQALTLYAYLYEEIEQLFLNDHGMDSLLQKVTPMS